MSGKVHSRTAHTHGKDLSFPEEMLAKTTHRPATSLPVLPALGIDFGTVRIGLALAVSPIVEPLTIIANSADALSYISAVVDDYAIATVVIGVSERRSAALATQFANQVKHTFGTRVRVALADETMSTQMARSRLIATGKKLKDKERIDHYAAACILEEWLDSEGASAL